MPKTNLEDNLYWSFALVNGKLAEVFFTKRGKDSEIVSHTYVKKEEYTTKRELTWIKRETEKFRIRYRSGKYSRVETIL